MSINVPLMWTVTEAHKETGLSKSMLYRLAKTGEVKAILAGKRILLNAKSLCDLLENSTLTTQQPKAASGGIRPIGR